jgi:hypothetical protein
MAGTANAAVIAHGCKLQRDSGGGYVTIADQVELPPPGLSRPSIEVTHAESPGPAAGVSFKEKIAGALLELKVFTIMISYGPTVPTHNNTTGLLNAITAGTKDTYRFVWRDANYWQFVALVIDFTPLAPREGQLRANVTFDPSGDVTFSV